MTIEIVIWCVGMVSMAATSWLQDRRDRRADEGSFVRLRNEYERRISNLEAMVAALQVRRE